MKHTENQDKANRGTWPRGSRGPTPNRERSRSAAAWIGNETTHTRKGRDRSHHRLQRPRSAEMQTLTFAGTPREQPGDEGTPTREETLTLIAQQESAPKITAALNQKIRSAAIIIIKLTADEKGAKPSDEMNDTRATRQQLAHDAEDTNRTGDQGGPSHRAPSTHQLRR